MSRYRNYTLTLNNYQDKLDIVDKIKSLPYKYLVWGEEEGEQGTPHKQGTIIFKEAKTETSARTTLKGCHVEVCKDLHASIAYCKKDGVYEEFGTAPMSQKEKGSTEQTKWKEIRIAAEEGRLDDIPDDIRFRQYKAVEHFRSEGSKRRKLSDTDTKHLWYYGESGTGKSRKAREENPDAYLKMCNKWWDGYEDQDTVIIEDFDEAHACLAHHIKIWGDRYPFMAEIKGGARKIRPRMLIITSNYHPKDIWIKNNDLLPIMRRFKIEQFGPAPAGPTTAPAGANTANLEEQMKSK